MIITKIKGGLGNQLFQYAAGRNISINKKIILKLDISDFTKYKNSGFNLSNFKININYSNFEDIKNFFFFKSKIINFFLKKISNRFFSFLNSLLVKNYYYEKNFFIKKIDKYSECYLDGYWINHNYFKNIRSVLINEIKLKKINKKLNKLIKEIKKTSCNSVSIHFRYGDYKDKSLKKEVGLLNSQYYVDAINYIKKYIRNPKFFIYSDEIEIVKKKFYFNNLNHVFVEGFKNYEDLISMSCCKHNIIANSTFSWWAAWLNENRNKTVICPLTWVNKNSKIFNYSRSFPLKEWKKMRNTFQET
jgi:hypothetical protein